MHRWRPRHPGWSLAKASCRPSLTSRSPPIPPTILLYCASASYRPKCAIWNSTNLNPKTGPHQYANRLSSMDFLESRVASLGWRGKRLALFFPISITLRLRESPKRLLDTYDREFFNTVHPSISFLGFPSLPPDSPLLKNPGGLSGGGLWKAPRMGKDAGLWSPTKAPLVGILIGWSPKREVLVATRSNRVWRLLTAWEKARNKPHRV